MPNEIEILGYFKAEGECEVFIMRAWGSYRISVDRADMGIQDFKIPTRLAELLLGRRLRRPYTRRA